MTTAANLILGPAVIYAGAAGVITAAPADSAVNSTPAASAWTDLGGTNGGADLVVTPKFTPLNVDQQVDDIDDRMTGRTVVVNLNLAEITLANLALTMNTTPGATGSGYATLDPQYGVFASQTTKISLLIDGLAPQIAGNNAPRRRLYIPKCQQIGPVTLANAKDKQTLLSVQFKAYWVSNSVPPYHITDQTT